MKDAGINSGFARPTRMKKIMFILLVGFAALAVAAEAQWLTDLPKAQAQAKAEKKLVLMDFTGSDWCSWCITLKKEIFDTKEFADYADKNLVLVEVDFPQRKKQSDAQKKANEALSDKYKIDGYPTVVVLDSAGKEVGRLGYDEGGPKPFIALLEKLKKK
ncbi:MAG: thioredoxin family protein [Verrucomicrobia bacterium]|nr:thioredoxin family protein [Verrucomicrobiota bacterium]